MWEKIRVVFTIPELRNKILLTLLLLGIYRIGWQIPMPFIDQTQIMTEQQGSNGLDRLLNQVAVFSASNLNQITIFGLGIMPYISASIIFQLLGSVWKPLEELQKEGETGRKKINEYTRYLTVLLCLFQSWMYLRWFLSTDPRIINTAFLADALDPSQGIYWGWMLVAVMTMTCGTIFLMWLGEQIDEFGIGNGISLLIMAGILARMPGAGKNLLDNAKLELVGLGSADTGVETFIVLALLFVFVVFGVTFITLGKRQIPTQSAKHVRGRKVFGGARSTLPLRINQAGVMPIIFSSSLLMFPGMLFGGLAAYWPFASTIAETLRSPTSFIYNLLYIGLIYFFCYFWTAITFNPKDMAENLKNFGTFIPGYRPGKRTADYLERVMVRITYVGAAFLAVVAIIPTVISGLMNVDFLIASFYGGTALLIAVSVAFDLVQKIDSHLVMRNYRGLLES
ncbi:MAG: preprotein translocase subunit SecY [Planctomycetaceae bacterium]|nr:preprotein translocase subunit SecY [Planctomycetaceae bacterium]MBP60576.1 preprotein translocase subunit SecY [Planctomycetaceae bacterium]